MFELGLGESGAEMGHPEFADPIPNPPILCPLIPFENSACDSEAFETLESLSQVFLLALFCLSLVLCRLLLSRFSLRLVKWVCS